MKILHFYPNARNFIRNCPFYNYIINNDSFESEICNFLTPGDVYPSSPIPVPLKASFSLYDSKDHTLHFKPDLLHCHDHSLLEHIVTLSDGLNIPAVFSVYRHKFNEIKTGITKLAGLLNKTKAIFVPSRDIKEKLYDCSVSVPMIVLGEVLDSSYNFKKTKITGKDQLLTFAVVISQYNKDYINNVHHGLEKILMTNKELKISWICDDAKIKQKIIEDYSSRSLLDKYVSITDLKNFPLLQYEGLIVDGNENYAYTDTQYLFFILSCIKEGKFILTRPDPGLSDILINNVTCITIPTYSSNELGHLIHFFISFQEEIMTISLSAMKFFQENHDKTVNLEKLKTACESIVKNTKKV